MACSEAVTPAITELADPSAQSVKVICSGLPSTGCKVCRFGTVDVKCKLEADGSASCVVPPPKPCRGRYAREKRVEVALLLENQCVARSVFDYTQYDWWRKPALEGRFSGRLPSKEDEVRLAEECRLLSPLVGGTGKRGDKSLLTLAKIVRGIASGDVRRHLEKRERLLQYVASRLSKLDKGFCLENVDIDEVSHHQEGGSDAGSDGREGGRRAGRADTLQGYIRLQTQAGKQKQREPGLSIQSRRRPRGAASVQGQGQEHEQGHGKVVKLCSDGDDDNDDCSSSEDDGSSPSWSHGSKSRRLLRSMQPATASAVDGGSDAGSGGRVELPLSNEAGVAALVASLPGMDAARQPRTGILVANTGMQCLDSPAASSLQASPLPAAVGTASTHDPTQPGGATQQGQEASKPNNCSLLQTLLRQSSSSCGSIADTCPMLMGTIPCCGLPAGTARDARPFPFDRLQAHAAELQSSCAPAPPHLAAQLSMPLSSQQLLEPGCTPTPSLLLGDMGPPPGSALMPAAWGGRPLHLLNVSRGSGSGCLLSGATANTASHGLGQQASFLGTIPCCGLPGGMATDAMLFPQQRGSGMENQGSAVGTAACCGSGFLPTSCQPECMPAGMEHLRPSSALVGCCPPARLGGNGQFLHAAALMQHTQQAHMGSALALPGAGLALHHQQRVLDASGLARMANSDLSLHQPSPL